MASENNHSSSSTTANEITNSQLVNVPVSEAKDFANNREGESNSATFKEVANRLELVPIEVVTEVHGGSGSGEGCVNGSKDGNKNNEIQMITKCIGRSNRGMSWSFALNQGMRDHMEDRIMSMKKYMSMPCSQFGGCTSPNCHHATKDSFIHYFGVFDGHGGEQVSTYCADLLHEIIAEEWESESGVDEWGPKWQIALSRAYEKMDCVCKAASLAPAGSTAVVVLLSACQIIAANCGDSRAVLVQKRGTVPLTNDHKPDRADEAERIAKEGGCIVNVDDVLRVGGILAMTRAIGDQPLKPWVSSVPEITFTARSKEDECLVIASDGIWDVMTTDEVGAFARALVRQNRKAALSGNQPSHSVANLIIEEARSRSSTDNAAVIAVDLKPIRKWRRVQPEGALSHPRA